MNPGVYRAILAAVSGDDWTFDERPAAEETELMRQRVWGARNVISLATDVPKHAFLAVLLANLQAPVLVLRGVAAAALHQLSSTNLGTHSYPRDGGLIPVLELVRGWGGRGFNFGGIPPHTVLPFPYILPAAVGAGTVSLVVFGCCRT